MSWMSWIVLGALLAVVVAVLRGLVQLVSWLVEEFIPEPRDAGHPKAKERPAKAGPNGALRTPEARHEHAHTDKPTVHLPVRTVNQVRRPSRLGRLWKRLKIAAAHKSFDYWVATALSEDDPELKIKCLSKALKLNPGYLPAWGMKGNALLGLGRYDEAIQCFDKSLELHPSALTWHRKGDCCCHLHKPEEALQCFHKAMEACPAQDRQLHDDIARMIRLVEHESRGAKAS
jgi:tetratricopeptide (TPR) repeat protein